VTSAAFGGFLNGLGVVLAIGSFIVGLLIGFAVLSQMNALAGLSVAPGSVQALGYMGGVGIGLAGVVVGMMLMWAGLVLRTLAVVAETVQPAVGDGGAAGKPSRGTIAVVGTSGTVAKVGGDSHGQLTRSHGR